MSNKIQKAIDVFEKPSKHIQCVHKCENGMQFLTYSQDLVAAFETAIDSLEKQIPKKPVKYGDTRQGLDNDGNSISKQEDCYECPSCDSFLGYVSDCKDENYQDNYCRNCGQAIDWSE